MGLENRVLKLSEFAKQINVRRPSLYKIFKTLTAKTDLEQTINLETIFSVPSNNNCYWEYPDITTYDERTIYFHRYTNEFGQVRLGYTDTPINGYPVISLGAVKLKGKKLKSSFQQNNKKDRHIRKHKPTNNTKDNKKTPNSSLEGVVTHSVPWIAEYKFNISKQALYEVIQKRLVKSDIEPGTVNIEINYHDSIFYLHCVSPYVISYVPIPKTPITKTKKQRRGRPIKLT